MATHAHTKEQHKQRGAHQQRAQNRDEVDTQRTTYNPLSRIKDIRPTSPVKHNQVCMLVSDGGDVLVGEDAQGVYYHDMRYLSQIEMRINGAYATALLTDSSRGSEAVFELTNAEFQMQDGCSFHKETLSIRRSYTIDDATPRMTQEIAIHNLNQEMAEFDLTLSFAGDFDDMFEIRGHPPGKRGTIQPAQAHGNALILGYDGADGHTRTTTITFSPAPQSLDANTATYHLTLDPRQRTRLTTTILFDDQGETPADHFSERRPASLSGAQAHRALREALAHRPQLETSNPLFDQALERSFQDLQMLATGDHGDVYIAAGVPWYIALFGRDSCITAYEILAYQPHIAKTTLEVLAAYQGTRFNDFQDEEPGKILHELRLGEMANLHEIPQIPYYGTVDATPWFLLLLNEYVRWTGDIAFFERMREHVERALAWIDENPKSHKTEFLAYGTRSERGLINQGWKDSTNGIVNTDGSLARAPIQLVEVQGYVYAAKLGIADLLRRTGEARRAHELERQAVDLKQRFNEAFWMPERDFYAMGIQRDHEQIQSIASNPGQALTFGIVDEARAAAVVARLMRQDMFCGWGIRTLSSEERAYNPLDYQVGSVWPHDNALIARGLYRYGHVEDASRVFTGMYRAAAKFKDYRLPEVFDGFSQEDYDRPVHYPVACSPQAWAAGSLPLMLQTALGLEPQALDRTLRICHPCLPSWLNNVTVHDLRVGQSHVSLRYQREGDVTLCAVVRQEGDLRVIVEY